MHDPISSLWKRPEVGMYFHLRGEDTGLEWGSSLPKVTQPRDWTRSFCFQCPCPFLPPNKATNSFQTNSAIECPSSYWISQAFPIFAQGLEYTHPNKSEPLVRRLQLKPVSWLLTQNSFSDSPLPMGTDGRRNTMANHFHEPFLHVPPLFSLYSTALPLLLLYSFQTILPWHFVAYVFALCSSCFPRREHLPQERMHTLSLTAVSSGPRRVSGPRPSVNICGMNEDTDLHKAN